MYYNFLNLQKKFYFLPKNSKFTKGEFRLHEEIPESEYVRPNVNKNGIIIVDNVLWYGDVANKQKKDRLTTKIREFNSFIKKNNKVESLILPIGDGLSVCRKI